MRNFPKSARKTRAIQKTIIQPHHQPTTTPLRRRGVPVRDRSSLPGQAHAERFLASTAPRPRRGRPTPAGALPRSARRRPRRRDLSQKRPRGRRGRRAAMLSMRPPHQILASRYLCFGPQQLRSQNPARQSRGLSRGQKRRRARPPDWEALSRTPSRPSRPAPRRRRGPRQSAPTARAASIMRHAAHHLRHLRRRRRRRTAR
mmetsp:Transcript_16951/g.44510  ORF Transcript_16951/g.44510 Transcript_16951/m.44510 type:complete len:202 (+) Transcript_16951:666-1271(+)